MLKSCPFCSLEDEDSDFLALHVDALHPEGGEPAVLGKSDQVAKPEVSDRPSLVNERQDALIDYIECPCGEFCLEAEFDSHLDMHNAEGTIFNEIEKSGLGSSNHRPFVQTAEVSEPKARAPSRQMEKVSVSIPYAPSAARKSTFSFSLGNRLGEYGNQDRSARSYLALEESEHRKPVKKPQRLGKAELGPHADEEQMPKWLRQLLEKGAKISITTQIGPDGKLLRTEVVSNEIRGLIPVLHQLCTQDDAVVQAYLCDPSVTHVVKMAREGGFCGYRNIQMMISYIQQSKFYGHEHFSGRIPSILQLQDLIERAWDAGFGVTGRVETGGIRGTRKYIGTPEAQTLFVSLGIPCAAATFKTNAEREAFVALLKAIEKYFTTDPIAQAGAFDRVCQTSLPPIYFQHPGHSLTIVGLEKRRSGAINLLVFDPMFQPSPAIRKLIGTKFRTSAAGNLLKAYRRGQDHLQKYRTFEIMTLKSDGIMES